MIKQIQRHRLNEEKNPIDAGKQTVVKDPSQHQQTKRLKHHLPSISGSFFYFGSVLRKEQNIEIMIKFLSAAVIVGFVLAGDAARLNQAKEGENQSRQNCIGCCNHLECRL